MTASREELVELGLLDPDSPDAEERFALISLALEHGASIEEIRDGIAQHRLHAVAGERILVDAPSSTLREVAAAAHVDAENARAYWRALGFPDAGLDEVVCNSADIEVLEVFEHMADVIGRGAALELARTYGSSLARMADAAIGLVRARVEAPMRAEGGADSDVAEMFVTLATDLVPRLSPMFEAVHRRHVAQAGRRYSLWGTAPTLESTTFAVVGFADLVGFTALTQELTAPDFDVLLLGFEQHVLDAIPPQGARLVKLIGDEAMFVAGTAVQAAAIAQDLVRAVHADPQLPEVRIGLGAGEVLVREGDVFGPTVNRAARLVALADPATVIVDHEVASELGTGRVTPLGERQLPGFDVPLRVFRLTP